MYVQRYDGQYVLNPHGEWGEDASYETHENVITVYVKNKTQLVPALRVFFKSYVKYEYVHKVGDLNIFTVYISGPILLHNENCHVTQEPVVDECLIFEMTVPSSEFANSKKRSDMLKYFVLGPLRTSVNFFKVVDEHFTKTEDNGFVTLRRK